MRCRLVNVYVPGILTVPGAARNWSGRAVTRTHVQSSAVAEKVEYLSGPGLTRMLFQQRRAAKLARTVNFYSDHWTIRLIGHSNGCDVILDALPRLIVAVEELHLVCPACDADFGRNGLNRALLEGAVGAVCCYRAGNDWVLHLARSLGRMFGYGTLGLKGPQNVDPAVRSRVGTLVWEGLGHSDCWADERFNQTMDHFIRA